MSRELDFIDFLNEEAERDGFVRMPVKHQLKRKTNSSYIIGIDESSFDLTAEERDFVTKYKKITTNLLEEERRLLSIKHEIYKLTRQGGTTEHERLRELNQNKYIENALIDSLRSKIKKLESSDIFLPLVEREKQKARNDVDKVFSSNVCKKQTQEPEAAPTNQKTQTISKSNTSPKVFNVIKSIGTAIITILFGFLYTTISWFADAIERSVYPQNTKISKLLKYLFIILTISFVLCFFVLAVFNLWGEIILLFLISAFALPMFLSLAFAIGTLIYWILDWLLSKIKAITKIAPIVAFFLTIVIVLSAIGLILPQDKLFFNYKNKSAQGDSTYTEYTDPKKDNQNIKEDASRPQLQTSKNEYDRIETSYNSNCYILNTKTKKYHLPSCSYLPDEENAQEIPNSSIYDYSEYSPCKHCLD